MPSATRLAKSLCSRDNLHFARDTVRNTASASETNINEIGSS